MVWDRENLHDPEGRGESLNLAWSQGHQNFEHEDYKKEKKGLLLP